MPIDLGLLNAILDAFENATAGWVAALRPYGLALFAALSVLDLAYVAYKSFMSGHESTVASHPIFAFINWLLRQGLLYTLLLLWPSIVPAIIASFRSAAAHAGGIDAVGPTWFLAQGVDMVTNMMSVTSLAGIILNPVNAAFVLFPMLVFLISFALMAGVMTLALIETYIAIGAGCLLFGFAGCRWTEPVANSMLTYAFRTGVKFFVTYLMSALIGTIIHNWLRDYGYIDLFSNFTGTITLAASSVVILVLMIRIPKISADLVSGQKLFQL